MTLLDDKKDPSGPQQVRPVIVLPTFRTFKVRVFDPVAEMTGDVPDIETIHVRSHFMNIMDDGTLTFTYLDVFNDKPIQLVHRAFRNYIDCEEVQSVVDSGLILQ